MIIYPNQLFTVDHLDPYANKNIILYEAPDFFTKYKFNRLKLVLHRATMQLYKQYLEDNHYTVQYIDFSASVARRDGPSLETTEAQATEAQPQIYQPNCRRAPTDADHSPNFLCLQLFEEYRKKTDKFVFGNFYMWMKKKLDILPEFKSLDKYNRGTMKESEIKRVPNAKIILSARERRVLIDAVEYVKKHFPDNPGPDWDSIVEQWDIPITYRHAIFLQSFFINNKLKDFGIYQDYMYFGNAPPTLYHSYLSSSLNIGLLNPADIIARITGRSMNKSIHANSLEGYIRQLFWREYQLYCYIYCAELQIDAPPTYPANVALGAEWYMSLGATGPSKVSPYNPSTAVITEEGPSHRVNLSEGPSRLATYPVEYCIRKAMQTGYLHHIERLMIIGNYMLLAGIKPSAGFRWFMEFSIDSYEWVMYQNVLDMVFNVTGHKTMKRIYISSSAYIFKMSNLTKKDSSWSQKWDKMFHDFLKKNKGEIGYPYE